MQQSPGIGCNFSQRVTPFFALSPMEMFLKKASGEREPSDSSSLSVLLVISLVSFLTLLVLGQTV